MATIGKTHSKGGKHRPPPGAKAAKTTARRRFMPFDFLTRGNRDRNRVVVDVTDQSPDMAADPDPTLYAAPRQARKRGHRKLLWSLLAAGVLVAMAIGATIAFFFVDMDNHANRVIDGVALGNISLANLSKPRAQAKIDATATQLQNAPIPVTIGQDNAELTPSDVGLSINKEGALAAALRVGRTGNVVNRFMQWGQGKISGITLDWPSDFDKTQALATLSTLNFAGHKELAEPKVTFSIDKKGAAKPAIEPPKPGYGLIIDAALPLIKSQLLNMHRQRTVLPTKDLTPRYSVDDAKAAIAKTSNWFSGPLALQIGTDSVDIPKDELAKLLVSQSDDSGYRIGFDQVTLSEFVRSKLPSAGTAAVNAAFSVSPESALSITPSQVGVGCCTPTSMQRLTAALSETVPGSRHAAAELGRVEPTVTTQELVALKISTKLGEFTTKFTPNQQRVKNIEKIADILRGKTVMPGAQFSVNKTLGPRRSRDGWVSAPVIESGAMAQSPGGGISQFATTLFNALFFAGIQVDEHKAHSIYISRYPKGREATLSYPTPDLAFTNNTPGNVMIWAQYDKSSVSVSIWGTSDGRTVTQEGPFVKRNGECQNVTLTRIVHWPDGQEQRNTDATSYRPEGSNCSGNPTASATTTTEPAPKTAKTSTSNKPKTPTSTHG